MDTRPVTGFDPAAEFLLDLSWPNLCEPANASERDPWTYRCKGCGAIVTRVERQQHFNHHRGVRRRAETARRKRIVRERLANLRRARAAA